MFKLLWLMPLLLAGLTACSSNFVPAKVGPDGEYIGWHCQGDVNSQERWHCSKTTMKDGMPVDMPAIPADTASKLVETDPVIAEPAPSVSPVQPSAKVSSASKVWSKDGFTIQIGAYTDREVATSVVESLAVQGDIRVVDIMVKERSFSVVVLGYYASVLEAQQAAGQLLKEQSSYWIRSIRSLGDAAVK